MSTADKLNKLLETKQAIKQAIIDKGVGVSDDTVFAEYPAKINAIEGASNIDLSNYATKEDINEIHDALQSVDFNSFATKENPEITGALSLNRQPDSEIGHCSAAIGNVTTASGDCSLAEGSCTVANKYASHAEGLWTIASGEHQHVQGKYNIEDTEDKYAHIVGNGEGEATRSNAHTLDWDGNAWFAGNITIGEDNKELATKDEIPSVEGLASEQYVTDTINQLGEALNTVIGSGEFLREVPLCYNKEAVLFDNLQVTGMMTNIDSAGFITGDNPSVYYTLTLHMGGESQSVTGQVVTQDGISFVVFMEGAIQIYIGFSVSDTGEQTTNPSKAVLIFYGLEITEGMGLGVSLKVYGPQPYVTQDILNNALGDIESLLGNI